MPNYSMDEADYWQVPEHMAAIPEVAAELGVRTSVFALGDPLAEQTPVALVLDMPAGYELGRHAHPCERFEVVVRGSIQVGDRTLGPGSVMIAGPNELYGPKTAGPDGCTTVEVFATMSGTYMRVTEGPDGLEISNVLENLAAAIRPNGVESAAE